MLFDGVLSYIAGGINLPCIYISGVVVMHCIIMYADELFIVLFARYYIQWRRRTWRKFDRELKGFSHMIRKSNFYASYTGSLWSPVKLKVDKHTMCLLKKLKHFKNETIVLYNSLVLTQHLKYLHWRCPEICPVDCSSVYGPIHLPRYVIRTPVSSCCVWLCFVECLSAW